MAEISLSYIIPCYNMERYLPVCLDSILEQDLGENTYEVIVVNDGSLDNSLQIARDYADKRSNFHIVDKMNAGVGAARNSGLLKASGEYIYFLDPDDYLATNCMNVALSLARENQLDLLSCESTDVGQNEYRPETTSNLQLLKNSALSITDGIEYVAHYKFHNEIWRNIIRKGFMDEYSFRFVEGRWLEDAPLVAELLCASKRVAHLDIDMHRYRILPTSAMHNKDPQHYRKLVYDIGFAAYGYGDLIKKLPTQHPYYDDCKRRLKARQQSFVFFLLIRLMKSDIEIGEIGPMLKEFEKIEAYPLNEFIGEDYNGIAYTFMVFILNHKPLIGPFTKVFRLFYRLIN